MNRKAVIFAVLLLLILAPAVEAWSWNPATWIGRAFKIGDGKDIDLNNQTIGNGSAYNLTCQGNCINFNGTGTPGANATNYTEITQGRIINSSFLPFDINNSLDLIYINTSNLSTQPWLNKTGDTLTGSLLISGWLNSSTGNAYLTNVSVLCGTNMTCTPNANGTLTLSSTAGGGFTSPATTDLNMNYYNITKIQNMSFVINDSEFRAWSPKWQISPFYITAGLTGHYANINGNTFQIMSSVEGSSTGATTAIMAQAVNEGGGGEVWASNSVGYSNNSGRSTGSEIDYGCLVSGLNCSSIGLMIVSQAFAKPDAAVWMFSANNESRPQHLIKIEKVTNSTGKSISPIDPAGTILLMNSGFTATRGIDMSGNVFTGSAIAMPGNSHGIQWNTGADNFYLDFDAGSNYLVIKNNTNNIAAWSGVTGNMILPALASKTANQSSLAVDSAGSLTRYTPAYHNELAARALGVTYTNTAGTDIQVYVDSQATYTPGDAMQYWVNGIEITRSYFTVSNQVSGHFSVPDGSSYSVSCSGTCTSPAINRYFEYY